MAAPTTLTPQQLEALRASLPPGHYAIRWTIDALSPSASHPHRHGNAMRECVRLYNERVASLAPSDPALREQVRALEVRIGILNGQLAAERARTDKAVAMHIEEQAAHQRTRGELYALEAQRKREVRPAEAPAFDREGAVL